jgi:hypothetical protein
MQPYENKTLNMLDKTIDDERQELPFSNYDVRICNFLQKFAAHLQPCGGTPVA